MKDYHINVFYSEEDEGYIADIPDLKHCSAFGETPEAALRQVLVAKAAWLQAAREAGKNPSPPPLSSFDLPGSVIVTSLSRHRYRLSEYRLYQIITREHRSRSRRG